jgi:hypothetical protein
MHQVLLIDEILRNIFTDVERDTGDRKARLDAFFRLATVCRAWKDPALDFLWESLASTDPLVALLPTVENKNGNYVRCNIGLSPALYSH